MDTLWSVNNQSIRVELPPQTKENWSAQIDGKTVEIQSIRPGRILLKDGRVFASGAKHDILTSANLSSIYGAKVKLTRHGERYALRLG